MLPWVWSDFPNSSPLHRSRWRRFVTTCPGGPLLSPPYRWLQPLRLLITDGTLLLPPPPLQLGHSSSLHNGRGAGRSVELAAWKLRSTLRSWDGWPRASGSWSSGYGDRTTPSPGGGPGGESFVSFLFCSTTGPQECDALSCAPCPAMEPGEYRTTHSDHTSGRTTFQVGPLCSTSLPHRGYVSDSPVPACTVSGGLARAPQAISLAPEDHQTRLRDSVCPASSQVQGRSLHLSVEQGCPCLACRSRGPAGEGRDRAGPSSRDEIRVL